jgi:hypothetical protein
MERRQPQGVIASDVGVYFGLSSFRPETTVVALKSASELEWEQQQREFRLWRMISTSDLSDAEKEQLHIQLFPWAEAGIMRAHAEAESHKFYQGLGYPEFGGKYAPFTVPSGAKVKGVSETSEGLKIEFEQTGSVKVAPASGFWDENRNVPVVKPTSGFLDQQIVSPIGKKVVKEEWLSEQLYNVQMGSELILTEKGPVSQPMRPLAPLAFLIAPAEYFAYGLVTMFRGSDFPSVSTPPETPTFFTNPKGVKQAGKTAMTASLLGEVLLSETLGFGFNVGLETVGKAVSPVSKLVQTSKPYLSARGSYFSFVNWLKNPEPFSENRVFYDVYSDTLKGKSSTSKELLRGTDWLKGESDDMFTVFVGESQDDSMTQFTKGLKYEKPKGGFTSRKLPLASEMKIAPASEEELYTRVFASVREEPIITQGASQVLIMEKPVSKVAVAVSTKEMSFAEMTPIPMLQLWTGKAYPFMSPSRRQQEETEIEVLSYPTSFMGFTMAKSLVQTDFLQRSPSRAVQGLSGFEVAPRLKPTAATFNISKAGVFSFSTFKPVSTLKFDQTARFKPVSGLRFDQAVKFNLQQFSGTKQSQKSAQEMRQSLKQLQKMAEPERAVTRRKHKKKAGRRGSGWVTTKYPFPTPEQIMSGFEMEVTI